jgi:hypothetical protein
LRSSQAPRPNSATPDKMSATSKTRFTARPR